MECDALIFGGGIAGLWTLDELTRRGCSAFLVEAGCLGSGQTIASQGILHGGLKYSLQGLLTPSAAGVRDLPPLWRACLAGRHEPKLLHTTVRSEFCYLWQTESLASRMGMWGARLSLSVTPQTIPVAERPPLLKSCPGVVARLDEQVISPVDLIANLAARNRERILRIEGADGVEFRRNTSGIVDVVRVASPESSQWMEIRPRWLILTAGAGNAELRHRLELTAPAMQRRPLHMVMLRGPLPLFNGHCVDGAKTRVTVTSERNRQGATVWQIGGQIAEDGVALDAEELLHHAARELTSVLPAIDLTGVEGATYRVDRAERIMPGGKRPETVQVLTEGNVVTAWPTKLVLAPKLAAHLGKIVASDKESGVQPRRNRTNSAESAVRQIGAWPRPNVAPPPWESVAQWRSLDDLFQSKRVA